MQELDIIERYLGYSNEMMIEECERMLRVFNQTKTTIIGRGKKRGPIEVKKHHPDPRVVIRIEKSLKYYKENGK